MKKLKFKPSYTQLIALSFLAVILVGSLILCLPLCSRTGEWSSLSDSMFTATSATCVTGLTVVDTFGHWSLMGQIVIILLIQIGGLGLMTLMTMFSILMKKQIGLHERRLLMQSAGSLRHSGVVRLIKRIVSGTLIFEGIGALILSISFVPRMGAKGIWYAVFHSISAFCNAGFDLFGAFGETSLISYAENPLVSITLMLLIIIGGLGFIVWSDISKHPFKFREYELHTKIVLTTTIALVFSGGIILYLLERNHAFADLSEPGKILAAFFQSVTTRTAGFITVNQAELSEGGSIVSMVLMFIGASPGSTGGGIKTTTFAVFLMSTLSLIRNEESVVIFKRRLDSSIVRQSVSIVCIYLLSAITASVIICVIEPFNVKQVMFEVISAMGTVGNTMGITPAVGHVTRFILIFLMYGGRIGGLTLAHAFTEKRQKVPLDRPSEKILIG